jgi:hypothetical protein
MLYKMPDNQTQLRSSEMPHRVYNKNHGDAPPDAAYIGRGSPYGNRFVIGKDGRDQVCDLFEREQLVAPTPRRSDSSQRQGV